MKISHLLHAIVAELSIIFNCIHNFFPQFILNCGIRSQLEQRKANGRASGFEASREKLAGLSDDSVTFCKNTRKIVTPN